MAEADIYSSVLDYMCENYDYYLYATDFDSKSVSSLQRSIASVSIAAGGSRIDATKTALQDFFDAIFQKVFVYEDEERLKIVKYFDKGALSEDQDKQIHALRQELITCKEEVEDTFLKDSLYMFDKSSRKRFETTLLSLNEIPHKDILREQISLVYSLGQRDIVVFLNGKVFLKKFNHKIDQNEDSHKQQTDILYDQRFIDSLWEEVSVHLRSSFNGKFDFLKYDAKEFYEKYPPKLFSILKSVVKSSFVDISDKDSIHYANAAFKNYLPKMLKEIADFLFNEVLESNLRAIKFLKAYSESTRISNNKMRLNKAPLMNKKGKIYNYQNILVLLKAKELLESKITHKKIELKNIQVRVKKSLFIAQRSEDEMQRIQQRRLELLQAIEKVEDEINSLDTMKVANNLDINRLEFSKRDLLEAFKQVEVRSRTQTNILNNTHKELKKWEIKKEEKSLLKDDLFKEQMHIEQEYKLICEILATALGKEPLEF
jgi:hypothetical protein